MYSPEITVSQELLIKDFLNYQVVPDSCLTRSSANTHVSVKPAKYIHNGCAFTVILSFDKLVISTSISLNLMRDFILVQ